MKKLYKSVLRFTESSLDIFLTYAEIEVTPSEGQTKTVNTSFRVNLGRPLYPGLYFIHQRAGYVLPNLISDLTKCKQEYDQYTLQSRLIQYTLDGLNEIINGKFEIQKGPSFKI